MINDVSNSSKYCRQKETKNILEYIHGGKDGALYDAWDYIARYTNKHLIEKFTLA